MFLAIVALATVAVPANAASLPRIFALQFDSTTDDFLGLGATLPQTHLLLAEINDGGDYLSITLLNGATFTPVTTFDVTASGWTIGNGAVNDSFTLTALQTGAPRLLTFTINTTPGTVNDTVQNVANADAILRQPAVLGSAFQFTNLLGGAGYQGIITAVPEPSSMALLLGCVTVGGLIRRRRS
jgi:hypothetical protein